MPKDNRPAREEDPIAEARRHWLGHGWSDTADAMATVTTIVHVAKLLSGRIDERLAPLNLTFARFEILRLLGFTRQGRLPMGKIGTRLQVHPASVTSAVQRLEREGLVERERSPDDHRVVLAVLLPAGVERLDRATDLVNDFFRSIESGPSGFSGLIDGLDGIRSWAGDPVGERWT